MVEQQAASLTDVFDALDRGATVVTGNKRLAAVTHLAFEQAAINKGSEVWPTPHILPWPAWLQDVWEEAVVSGAVPAPELLLTSQQERHIWEAIIIGSMAEQSLQQVTGTVHQAQEAMAIDTVVAIAVDRRGIPLQ